MSREQQSKGERLGMNTNPYILKYKQQRKSKVGSTLKPLKHSDTDRDRCQEILIHNVKYWQMNLGKRAATMRIILWHS